MSIIAKRYKIVILLIIICLLGGCSKSKSQKEVDNNETKSTLSTRNILEEGNTKDTSKESEDTEFTEVTEDKKLADIEELAKTSIFHVNWYTEDGEYSAGTTFLIDSKKHGKKVMVTAFHFLWPEDVETFRGSDLPDFVKGGEVSLAYSGEPTEATLESCLIIEDADVVPKVDKDIACFTLHNADNLNTLPLATESCEVGETIYLLANLYETDDVHENCVYEAKVINEQDGILYYHLDERYGTRGASGAPLVNKYGEVVGIHIGSIGSTRVGNAVMNFAPKIDKAIQSETEYPSDISTLKKEETSDNTSETIFLEQNEEMSTTFFDLSVTDVSVSNERNGNIAEEGYQYLVLGVELSTSADIIDDVYMYYNDFWVEWSTQEEDYCYPLETGYTDKQLPEEYVLSPGTKTEGDLVFLIPTDCSNVTFGYQDYYTEAETETIQYGDYFAMNIKTTK